MKAPFPWFGGKSRAAHLVWEAFGPDVANYVEPFAGSLAVLLGRPSTPRIETVNDLDCYLSNFWRALQAAPAEVAKHADWPVNEADLHARHRWLVGQLEFRERMRRDPEYFDAKIAGWWCWGICQWIGSGWCTDPDWEGRTNVAKMPKSDRGDLSRLQPRSRDVANSSEWQKRPQLGKGGRGVGRNQIPMLRGDSGAAGAAGAAGAGVHASGLVRNQLPDLGGNGGNGGAAGKGVTASAKTSDAIVLWMHQLSDRLRRVRVCCGDWKRVLGRSATECIGITGVFLDPPYGEAAGRDPSLYAQESLTVAGDVREWALEHGDNPKLRIALCGYEGEHAMPKGWECVKWKANGGYAAAAGNHENAARERIWFSPHCLSARRQGSLALVTA